jgi:hypothetical protein
MKIDGKIKSIEIDGYERLLSIQTDERLVWCNFVQSNEYLEPGQSSMYLKVDEPIQLKVGLFFIADHRLLEGRVDNAMIQDIHGSPHTIVVGEVVEKISPDTYLIEIEKTNQIEAQFEFNMDLNVGDYIRVVGELAVQDGDSL